MTKKDRELLREDLCSRLPYGVKVSCVGDFNHKWYNLEMVDIGDNEVYITTHERYANRCVEIKEVKPYLRPMSSMNEEQLLELASISFENSIDSSIKTLDWLNKNHFDYRGLIEKGLAIEAPEGMYN